MYAKTYKIDGTTDGLMTMIERWFAKRPCKNCPFRTDVTPFLHPERANEISSLASNPYSEFICHATLDHDDDDGEPIIGSSSLVCAGFLAMQINESGKRLPEGFAFPDNVYSDSWDMMNAYQAEWDKKSSRGS